MKAKRLLEATPKTFALVFESGEAVMEPLEGFARQERISAGSLQGIGAFSRARVGFFDPESRRYRAMRVDEQTEVLSMIGDIALGEEGEPEIHAHIVLGRRDATTVGGHLLEATVRPTLEVVLTEAPQHLRRRSDPDSGLALIDLDQG